MVKSVVKPLKMGFLREKIVPKKSVFTRDLGVFHFEIPWGRCLAPKPGALPTALHPATTILYQHKGDLSREFVAASGKRRGGRV